MASKAVIYDTATGQWTATTLDVSLITATGTPSSSTYLRGDGAWTAPSGTGDTSSNTATSVDGEVVLFSGTGGKTLKRATGTGLAKLTSGVQSTVTAPAGAVVGDTDTQTLTSKTIDGASNTVANVTAAPLPVRLVANSGLTYTISAGSVTQIAGTTVDSVTANVGDRILIIGAPAATGAGSNFTTQPGNGLYTVTNATTNLTVSRAPELSGTNNPWGISFMIREGTGWASYLMNFIGSGAVTWGTTAVTVGGWSYFGGRNDLPVDISATQTLAGKTLTSPKISNSLLGSVAAGAVEYDGAVFYNSTSSTNRGLNATYMMCRQDSAYTLTSTTSVQQLFNASANGRLTLPTGTYRFNCLYSLASMSATSGNGAFSIAGTATLGTILMYAIGRDGSVNTVATLDGTMNNTAAFPNPMHTGTTAAGLQDFITGTFEVTVTGTIIPSFALNTAAAAVNAAGSFFECWQVGSTTVATIGNWS